MKKLFIFIAVGLILTGCGGGTQQQQNQQTAKPAEPKKPKIEVLSHNVTNSTVGITVAAVVKNNTDKTASYVELKAVYLDENNNIIGTGMGNTLELESGQTKTIEILTIDNLENAKTYRVEVATTYW